MGTAPKLPSNFLANKLENCSPQVLMADVEERGWGGAGGNTPQDGQWGSSNPGGPGVRAPCCSQTPHCDGWGKDPGREALDPPLSLTEVRRNTQITRGDWEGEMLPAFQT